MIPRAFIVIGIFMVIIGVIGLLSLILLPIKERHEIVYDREYDYIRTRMDPIVGKFVWRAKKELIRDYFICLFMGVLLFFAGLYVGFAEEGEGFWFYKQFYPQEAASQIWDDIDEDGKYVAEDGKKYTYYILVSGKEISISGEKCADLTEVENRLSAIKRENKVILIDSFAASSTYRSIMKVLNELGIEYEESN